MYYILKKAGTDDQNMWAYYTENGVWWSASTADAASTKVESLAKTIPVDSLRIVQNIDFTVDVVVTPEPEPEPEVTP